MFLLLACAGGESADPCADAPTLSWENFGAGFVTQSCQSCHASTSAERNGAPEGVVFDSADEVWAQRDRVLAVATGEAPTMPPEGGVEEDERLKLELWLSCAEPGT